MEKILVIGLCLVHAHVSFRFLYELRFPAPGTRPPYWKLMLEGPVTLIGVFFALAGIMNVFGLFGAFGG